MGPCHLAGRSFQASCLPLARGKPSFAILATLGFPTPARLARAHPSRTRIPRACARNRSPPARAGGTAGRWAIPVPGSPSPRSPPTRPKRHHHQINHNTSYPGGTALCSGRGRREHARIRGILLQDARLANGSRSLSRKDSPSSARASDRPLLIKAPRREPAGRRVVGRSRPPEATPTVHHHPAQSAFTTNTHDTSSHRAVGPSRPPEATPTVHHQPAQSAFTTNHPRHFIPPRRRLVGPPRPRLPPVPGGITGPAARTAGPARS